MADFRFPKAAKLRRTSEYRVHRGRSRSFRTRHFIVAWAPGEQGQSRLGLTVSKKVGNSPQRSRVKRLLREWFRLERHRLEGDWDLVVIARSGAPGLHQQDVHQELGEFLTWINRRQASRRPATTPGN